MNKMLVAIFDREAAAYEGLSALKDLHREGDISLYSSAVVAKDNTGKIALKQAADAGPVGTAVGLLTGSLMGLLGGPAGMALGASLGGLAGLVFDANESGVDLTFLDDVSNSLTGGRVAVVAEIDESWTAPVDARLNKLGGVIFRRLRGEVVEDQIARESAAFEADLKALNDELKQATAENRAAIQKDIERVKTQIKTTRDQAKARLDQAKAETEARVKALQEQAKTATGLAKARIEKRIADAKADFDRRSQKLSQAWALTKEALAA
ncbi:MAG: DUF1269 domain-containing protein [Alphaproteobacteria bacterium]|nr:MAG: DUF1269 domain-containing protein [Alphaproteobacteria bacterium]